MTWSFSVGRLFGSELRIHATFFLLLAWVGIETYAAAGVEAALENLGFVLALFVCVIAHEYGHALMARRYGIRTPDITLLPIGGLARLERMPVTPMHEVAVALAGPAVNVAIWAVLTGLFGADAWRGFDGGILDQLAAVNVVLALFNMIPAFPMDGGRVLRALLSLRFDRRLATGIAAGAGQAVAVAMGGWGLWTGNPVLALIGVFIFLAARAEARAVRA